MYKRETGPKSTRGLPQKGYSLALKYQKITCNLSGLSEVKRGVKALVNCIAVFRLSGNLQSFLLSVSMTKQIYRYPLLLLQYLSMYSKSACHK